MDVCDYNINGTLSSGRRKLNVWTGPARKLNS